MQLLPDKACAVDRKVMSAHYSHTHIISNTIHDDRETRHRHSQQENHKTPKTNRFCRQNTRFAETYVVECAARCTTGHDLQRSIHAIRHARRRQHGQRRDAVRAVAGDVEELGRERDVEVARVGAEPEVDEDVRPGVVQVERYRAASQGPICSVTCAGGDAAACGMLACCLLLQVCSETRTERGREGEKREVIDVQG